MDSRPPVNPDPRRSLPSVDRLIRRMAAEHPDLPLWAVKQGAREVLGEVRSGGAAALESVSPGGDSDVFSETALVEACAKEAGRLARHHPTPVVNATGVVLHTNLGRAPLAPGAARAASEVAAHYSDLELDLASGRRGNRLDALAEKLRLLSGAPGAYACNNNAAALLLVLDTLARGREVIVSRGELVEIGGSFRVPEIVQRAGVRLVEVGTTNRTHPADYENAIGTETALLLKVHRSNFEQTGFVSEVDLATLGEIGKRRGLPVVEDLGSATLVDLTSRGLPVESYAPLRLSRGADLVCFSGDKLLGGPQAGILLGDAEVVDRARRNPLARALRLDKMGVAALDWTLESMLGGTAEQEIPVLRRLLESAESLERRAHEFAARLRASLDAGIEVSVAKDRAEVGGGSLPGFRLETWVVELSGELRPERAAAALRGADVPILARIRDGVLVLDLRTLEADDCDLVEEAARRCLR